MARTIISFDHLLDCVERSLGVAPEVGFSGGSVLSLWARMADGSGRVVQIGDLGDPLVVHQRIEGPETISPEGFTVLTYKDEDTLMDGGDHLFSTQIEPNLFDLMDELRRHVYEAREPRVYCQGLPVVVTVHADGRVEHEVDFGDLDLGDDAAPTDDDGRVLYTEDQIDADQDRVTAWLTDRERGVRA